MTIPSPPFDTYPALSFNIEHDPCFRDRTSAPNSLPGTVPNPSCSPLCCVRRGEAMVHVGIQFRLSRTPLWSAGCDIVTHSMEWKIEKGAQGLLPLPPPHSFDALQPSQSCIQRQEVASESPLEVGTCGRYLNTASPQATA